MPITRRDFLKIAGAAATVATGCSTGTEGEPDATSDAALRDGALGLDADRGDALDAGLDALAPDAGAGADAGSEDAMLGQAPNCESDETVETSDAGVIEGFASVPYDGDAFPLGVMGGDPLSDRAMAWTKYTGSRRLVLRVLELNRAGTIIRVAYERPVTPSGAGFAHVDIPGLRSNHTYRFAFLAQDGTRYVGRSRAGRFRTAPRAGSCDVIDFGGTSCNGMGGAPFAPLQHAADANLDFFIHCGDHIYADSGEDAVTLSQYRAKYSSFWQVAGLRELHASTGLITTWDDHEVFNNWNAETIDDTAAGRARLAAATQTFFEHRAFRRNTTVPNRIWRKLSWGQTADIFMLDCRGERRPSTRATAGAQFISRAQLDWLKAGLSASTAVFKFVVTSKPITGRVTMDLERDDYWEGYPAQRANLLSHIVSNRIPGVWFLSGDVHLGAIARVEASGPYRNLREVYMGPAGSGDPDVLSCTTSGQYDARIHRLNYTRFRADPLARTLRIEFIGAAGNILCSKTYPA